MRGGRRTAHFAHDHRFFRPSPDHAASFVPFHKNPGHHPVKPWIFMRRIVRRISRRGYRSRFRRQVRATCRSGAGLRMRILRNRSGHIRVQSGRICAGATFLFTCRRKRRPRRRQNPKLKLSGQEEEPSSWWTTAIWVLHSDKSFWEQRPPRFEPLKVVPRPFQPTIGRGDGALRVKPHPRYQSDSVSPGFSTDTFAGVSCSTRSFQAMGSC